MRILARNAFLSASFILVALNVCLAQAPQQALSIAQLKEQILRLESIDRDMNTPYDVKYINRGFLEERRVQLEGLLRTRIQALKNYLTNVGGSLSPKEKRTVEDSIKGLENDLSNLKANTKSVGRDNLSSSKEVSIDEIAASDKLGRGAFSGNSEVDKRKASAPVVKTAPPPPPPVAQPPVEPPQLTCPGLCDIPKGDIEIDANTGAIRSGSQDFGADKKTVVVVYVNKNPFKYAYRPQNVCQPLSSAIAASVLRLIPGMGAIIDGLVGGPRPLGAPPQPPPGCDVAQWNPVVTELTTVQGISKALKDALTAKAGSYDTAQKAYDDFQKLTDTEGLDCGTVCPKAQTLLQTLKGLASLDDVTQSLADLNKKITALENKYNALPDPCKAANNDIITGINALKEQAKKYDESLKALKDVKKALDEAAQTIESILSNRESFVQVVYLPTASLTGTGCTLQMLRRNIREPNAKEEPAFSTPIFIKVGESPLSLSAGIGFSTIPDRRIVRQASLADDGTTVINRFGFESNSPRKPSGVIMLNGRLTSFSLFGDKDASFALSSGLVLSARNGTVEPEFIAGPSLGFMKDTMFLTFGYHTARVESLGGNFQIGDEVPASLQDPLPLERSWKNGFMIGLSYKLK